MKHIKLIVWLGIFLCGSLASMSQHPQPKRVGGNVLASKLIHRVEPVYPQEAIDIGLQGVVILVVTVNEEGVVTDTRVTRGHPFFKQSAMDAVRQWRYSPIYHNGFAVPVTATVTVNYNISYRLVMDEQGVLRDPESDVQGDVLIGRLTRSQGLVVITLSEKAPFNLVEEKLVNLQEHGAPIAVTNSPYVFHEGRLFYSLPGPATEPELVLDREFLHPFCEFEYHRKSWISRAPVGRIPDVLRNICRQDWIGCKNVFFLPECTDCPGHQFSRSWHPYLASRPEIP